MPGERASRYDVAFRHRQALDPRGLDSIGACLHALQAATKHCRNAGSPFETHPAVVPLAQHLRSLTCRLYPHRAALRALCAAELGEVEPAASRPARLAPGEL